MQIGPAPDFPTGAMILGQGGARNAYTTGRGSIMMRATHAIEAGRGDRRSIVLPSIPFLVGKSGLVDKIADAARDRRIEGVSDFRAASKRQCARIVLDLNCHATADVRITPPALAPHAPSVPS